MLKKINNSYQQQLVTKTDTNDDLDNKEDDGLDDVILILNKKFHFLFPNIFKCY